MNISDLTPEARRDEWGRMVRAHAREGFAGKRPRPYFSYGPGGHGNEIYDDLVQEDDIELAERELWAALDASTIPEIRALRTLSGWE